MTEAVNYNRWRIGLASNALRYLRDLGIPEPTEWTYRPFSQRVSQSKGGEGIQGYKVLVLNWRDLSQFSLYILRTYIDSARAASPDLLYLTIPRADGTAPGRDWVDISGRVAWPDFQPGPKGHSGTNVVVRINNITIVNTPASF